ncbi:MAG TPA: sugar ABC transporter permease [Armatimonadaceae bacterium]|nr:sugar ABC transporter permease [Armatimonadaceae bacterium]
MSARASFRTEPMTDREKKEARDALLFLSPWLAGFVLFTAGPILFSLYLSFCRWDVIRPIQWIGLANYQQMFSDRLLLVSLKNTIFYAALYIPLSLVVALSLAMLLNQKVKGIGLFRTLFYLPTLTQGVATFTLWSLIFDPETGLLNRGLRTVIPNPPGWLLDPAWSKPALVLMALWSVGGTMLIFLAGLKNIPADLYEAANIDGAKPWTQFWRVTLPMLSPTIFFNVIMGTIGAFQVFAAAFVLTSGGPSNSTLFYVYYLFNRAFVYFNMGYASAMAWLLFAIVLVLTVIQMRISQKWVHYG